MQTYAGIDLHSSNIYLGISDENDKRLFAKRLPNQLDMIVDALNPYKDNLQTVAVESTYNWYWLVDGLQQEGFPVVLANPSAFKQYEGIKHTDDKWDSFWLAHMARLGILPKGYIYPKQQRPVRDLLRRRALFVKNRTSHLLSLQSMFQRHLGRKVSANMLKRLEPEEAEQWFDSAYEIFTVQSQLAIIKNFQQHIKNIEKQTLAQVKLKKEFELLRTITGIGKILALTIMLEVGDIDRFEQVGNYASYCRCVKSQRTSNNKKKGENNRKNGNRYLGWAYVEAANFSRRYCPLAQRFYQRKRDKTNSVVAIKALSNKLARASYYIMRDQVAYDAEKLFCR
jgi:transposase